MMLKIYLLDYAKTTGMGGATILHMPAATELHPNDIIYFCGLIVALLMQILIVYDYFLNYVAASTYFVWSQIPEIKYLVKKLGLKPVSSTSMINKYFWFIASTIFSIEVLYSLIKYYYCGDTLLNISLHVWSFVFFQSLISITFMNKYIRNTEDIKLALRMRDKKIYLLEREILKYMPIWRAEEMQKHGENYDEKILMERMQEYKNNKMRVINEIINMKDNYAIEILQNPDIEYDGTFVEWFQTPTQQNIVNLFFYGYYLLFSSKDSPVLYDFFCLIGWFRTPLNHIEVIKLYGFHAIFTPPVNFCEKLFTIQWDLISFIG